jgi:hypothetical protein
VHGVGGDALGSVGGRGVAEAGGGMDVVEGQPDDEVAAVVPDGESAVVAHCSDRPAVAVLHLVGGGEAESSVVGTGDDHVAHTGLVPVRRMRPSIGPWVVGAPSWSPRRRQPWRIRQPKPDW